MVGEECGSFKMLHSSVYVDRKVAFPSWVGCLCWGVVLGVTL